MLAIPIAKLIPVLQVAIGPVILISGVGLLLLTLTNRFGRAVDRSRQLAREMREHPDPDPTPNLNLNPNPNPTRDRLGQQVDILFRRAALIRWAIIMAAVSVLLASVLIIALFAGVLLQWEAGPVIAGLFTACMLSLIISLVAFIRDIHLSLVALKLELRHPAS